MTNLGNNPWYYNMLKGWLYLAASALIFNELGWRAFALSIVFILIGAMDEVRMDACDQKIWTNKISVKSALFGKEDK